MSDTELFDSLTSLTAGLGAGIMHIHQQYISGDVFQNAQDCSNLGQD
jgi:hypothetical protein